MKAPRIAEITVLRHATTGSVELHFVIMVNVHVRKEQWW